MTVINTNVGALTARTYALKANESMQKSMERLSSGLRINSAADDAAGLAVANKMESQLRGMNVAIRNSQDGISLVQTAESGMGEISNMVVRMRELAVQMNNGVYTDADRQNAQLEVDALLLEINKIANNTAFNDVKVLDGTYAKEIRAGNTNAEVIPVTIDAMTTDSLGGAIVTTGSTAAAVVGSPSKVASAVSASVQIAGTSEKFTMSASNLSTDMQAQTAAGYFEIAAISSDAADTAAAAKFSIVRNGAGAGDISTLAAEAGGQSLTFDVLFKSNTDDSVLYTDRVTINTVDYVPAPSTSTSVELSVEEAQDITLAVVDSTGVTGVMSSRFKEFVAADTGTTGGYSFKAGTGDLALFDINTSTGAITMDASASAVLSFENQLDGTSTGTGSALRDGVYEFTVVYTDSNQRVFEEAVKLTVTDDATTDAAILGTGTPTAGLTGFSSYIANSNTSSVAGASIDLQFEPSAITGAASLSAQAKDFIEDAQTASSARTYAITNVELDGNPQTTASGADLGTVNGDIIELKDDLAAGVWTADITITAGGATFTESISVTITDSGTASSAPTAVAKYDTSATETFSASQVGGEALTVDLKAALSASGAPFAELQAFATANGANGTFSLVGAPNTASLDTATGVVTLMPAGEPSTTTASSIVVKYTAAGGEEFQQTIAVATPTFDRVDKATNAVSFTSQSAAVIATADAKSEVTGGKTALSLAEAREATIKSIGTDKVLSASLETFSKVSGRETGTFSLTGTDASSFKIDAKTGDITSTGKMDFETKSSFAFNVVFTAGDDVYTEIVELSVTNDSVDDVTHVSDVDMSTAAGAAEAVTILDKALNQISSSQAKLGAIQNRLQHNIDNLSMASMLTETARGRIVDADFARETSELSKQQILGQAATSMLAQANQSKQSVLALLQ